MKPITLNTKVKITNTRHSGVEVNDIGIVVDEMIDGYAVMIFKKWNFPHSAPKEEPRTMFFGLKEVEPFVEEPKEPQLQPTGKFEALINQPPHGHVRYVDHLGTDLRVAEAARASYLEPSKGAEKDAKLIHYMMGHDHTSPFEQCNITFEIKMPIFVMRQFVRQRTFRLNEWSGRYCELKDEFFLPSEWRAQDTKNKQSSVSSKKIDQVYCSQIADDVYKYCYKRYLNLLAEGVAKEQARIVLPLGIYTQIYVNCDLSNLMKFLRKRTAKDAQAETRDMAVAMETIFSGLFPVVYGAYKRFKPQFLDMEAESPTQETA